MPKLILNFRTMDENGILKFSSKDFDTVADIILDAQKNGKSARECAEAILERGYDEKMVRKMIELVDIVATDERLEKYGPAAVKAFIIMRLNVESLLEDEKE